MKRRPNETYREYRARRNRDNQRRKKKLRGRLIWAPRMMDTFTRTEENLKAQEELRALHGKKEKKHGMQAD